MRLEQLIEAAREEPPRADQASRLRLRLAVANQVRALDHAARANTGAERAHARARVRRRTVVLLAAAMMLVVGTGFAMIEWHRRFGAVSAVQTLGEQAPERREPASATVEIANEPSVADAPLAPSAASPHAMVRVPKRSSPSTPQIEAEMALLRDARDDLGQEDGAAALSVLDRYDSRFRAGTLSQEAAALRVLALCSAGRQADARAHATAFVKRWPESPMRTRVEKSCAARAPP